MQASVLDVGSDVTIQRCSFFEILEIIFTFMHRNDNHMYIFRILYFLGRFTFAGFNDYTVNL